MKGYNKMTREDKIKELMSKEDYKGWSEEDIAEEIQDIPDELLDKGYAISDFDGTGMLEIQKLDVLYTFKNDKEFVETLMGIVKLLAEGNQIPEEYNPHSLKGNWKNYMECHIENDTLLIWFDKNNNAIELVRLGSHSEYFGKGRKR